MPFDILTSLPQVSSILKPGVAVTMQVTAWPGSHGTADPTQPARTMNQQQSTDLARALFDEAGDALFLFDPETDKILEVNPMAERLCGFSRDELRRMPVTHLYRFEGPGGKQRLQRAAQNTGIFHGQHGFLLRTNQDGVWVPVSLTITRLHLKAKTLALITARDVREQREAHAKVEKMEAELRRVMTSVSDCLWSAEIDAAGQWRYRYISPVIEKLTGRPAEFFKSLRQWHGIVHVEDRARHENLLRRLRSGEAVQEEYRVVWPDDSSRWVRDSVLVSRPPNERTLHFNGVLTDISERKQAAEALAASNRQLQVLAADLEATVASEQRAHEVLKKAQSQMVQTEKLAALGQMVAGIAHEINNPLAFVGNNVVVLKRDVQSLRDLLRLYQEGESVLSAQVPELHAKIRTLAEEIDLDYTLGNLEGLMTRSYDGVQRIQQIVKGLRDFARLDESELKEADLNAGIESTIVIMRGEARKKKVELVMELSPLPPVMCFPARLNQVVLNLVANAIDACPDGGQVTVRTEACRDAVLIQVRDNGQGIDPAIRSKIFDPFFTTKGPGKGTGLGLSISFQIVQDHGGRIQVDSTLGQGTTFSIHLPLKGPARPMS
jgi:two-component system, NtrC family, sensor kinase